jgi:hypothetical protein
MRRHSFEGQVAMKRPDKPAYWQLDLFILLMIMLLLMMHIDIALQCRYA